MLVRWSLSVGRVLGTRHCSTLSCRVVSVARGGGFELDLEPNASSLYSSSRVTRIIQLIRGNLIFEQSSSPAQRVGVKPRFCHNQPLDWNFKWTDGGRELGQREKSKAGWINVTIFRSFCFERIIFLLQILLFREMNDFTSSKQKMSQTTFSNQFIGRFAKILSHLLLLPPLWSLPLSCISELSHLHAIKDLNPDNPIDHWQRQDNKVLTRSQSHSFISSPAPSLSHSMVSFSFHVNGAIHLEG